MSTAEELLASAFASDVLKVDLANRTIIIPDSVKHLGVTSDEDVMKVLFELPRFYGDIDLSEFEININYKNAKGYGDVSPATDITLEPGIITFAWAIDRYVTAYAGKVKFSVCLKNPDTNESDGIGQELNTQPAELPVLEGLETSESIPEEFPHLYRDLLERVKVLEDKVGGVTQEYKISGKWILNSPVNLTGTTAKCTINNVNVKTGTAYDISVYAIVAVEGLGLGYSLDELGESSVMATDANGVLSDSKYRYLDFGTGVIVPKEFYVWFMATAVQGVYTQPATTYKITNNLTNCSNANSSSTVAIGGSYIATIVPSESYALSSVKVLMSGVDVTSSVYSNGTINISSVTGDIIITATATAITGGDDAGYYVEGEYYMNETVSLPSSMVRSGENDEGGTTGNDYRISFTFMIAMATGLFYHIDGSNVRVAPASDGEATFMDSSYRNVNFVRQAVTQEFYEWLHDNAEKM